MRGLHLAAIHAQFLHRPSCQAKEQALLVLRGDIPYPESSAMSGAEEPEADD